MAVKSSVLKNDIGDKGNMKDTTSGHGPHFPFLPPAGSKSRADIKGGKRKGPNSSPTKQPPRQPFLPGKPEN